MVDRPVIVIGAGGHAKVLVDALLLCGARVLGCTDADPSRHGGHVLGVPVLGDDGALAAHRRDAVDLVIGIGSTRGQPLRRDMHRRLAAAGWRIAGVRHPACIVAPSARLDASVQVLAGAVVQAGAVVEEGSILSTGSVVEHDVRVGAFCHVAPRAVLCGDVIIGEGVHVGAGSVVLQSLRLGAGMVVGAGAVVTATQEAAGLLVGVPARRVPESRT
jgi:sugar O-acyltransferase (sialic acid O-acetyltransferase NeuD family)